MCTTSYIALPFITAMGTGLGFCPVGAARKQLRPGYHELLNGPTALRCSTSLPQCLWPCAWSPCEASTTDWGLLSMSSLHGVRLLDLKSLNCPCGNFTAKAPSNELRSIHSTLNARSGLCSKAAAMIFRMAFGGIARAAAVLLSKISLG